MPTPDPHAIAMMVLTVLALVLFTRDRIPLETSSLVVIGVLALGFQLFPYSRDGDPLKPVEFFAGFAHEALIAVVALMVVGHGLVRTGALEPVGRLLAKSWARSPSLSVLLTMVTAAVLSAFINNTPIVVLLLPILISVALRSNLSPSKTLLPVGLATVVGGTATVIGTSTNLLVVSVAVDLGLERFGMFDFAVPAMIVGGVGILYLWLIAPRLLPERTPPLADTSPRVFTARLHIPEESPGDGATLADLREKASGLRVTQVRRGAMTLMPLPDSVLRAGDKLVVSDTPERLKEYEKELGVELFAGDKRIDEEHGFDEASDQQIAEIVVTPQTMLVGTTLRQARFEDRYPLRMLALHRSGSTPSTPLTETVLRVGDVLLVQGDPKAIRELKLGGELMVLDATVDLPHTSKAPTALAILVAVVASAASGLLPIAISAVCGVIALLFTRCLRWQDVTRAVSPAVILVVVASLALGTGLQATGATDYVAGAFLSVATSLSPPLVLSGLILLLAVLTNVVSNNAAAVIGTPFAVAIANGLGAPPEPFVLAVLFGANMSYATPMAYQTNLLVLNAGGYTFSDFVRVGVPLTLLLWLGYSLLLPRLYGML
ncbi:MAG: SLC13 family permease [Gammaproteobacteria bacterium]|nr:SLC13 family permease [Gammaproteobacteria bacterium]